MPVSECVHLLRLCVHERVWQFTQRAKHKEDGFLLGFTHKRVSVFIQRLLSVYAALLCSLCHPTRKKKIISFIFCSFLSQSFFFFFHTYWTAQFAIEPWDVKCYSCLNIFFKLLLGAIWWKSAMAEQQDHCVWMWSTTEACWPKSSILGHLMIHSIPNWAKCVFSLFQWDVNTFHLEGQLILTSLHSRAVAIVALTPVFLRGLLEVSPNKTKSTLNKKK